MLKILSIAFIAALLVSLGGCSTGTSSCTDSDVKDTVINLVTGELKKAVWGREAFDKGTLDNLRLSRIKTAKYDEDLDQYTCNASFLFDVKAKTREQDIRYVNSYLEDEGDTEVIVYGANDVKNRIMATVIAMSRN